MKELCDCGKTATWCYMPGYGDHSNPYSCDGCVPRGCTCNWRYVKETSYFPPLDKPDLPTDEDKPWKWIVKSAEDHYGEIKEGEVWVTVDDKDREWPCVEYDYSEDGYDK